MTEDQEGGVARSTQPGRRTALARGTTLLMAGGLAAGYGAFAAIAGRFLYPADDPDTVWLYVTDLASFAPGSALHYKAPSGASITVTRSGGTGDISDFRALSSTCPHLGCQVHWEPHNDRFFCPCHNGVFDPSGKATAGPPAEASQSLPTYSLRIENSLLYIQLPAKQIAAAAKFERQPPAGPPGPGHDPCLFACQRPASDTSRKV